MFCKVAVKTPFNKSVLTYSEGDFSKKIDVGSIVEVPLGKRIVLGCILMKGISQLDDELDAEKIKPISGIPVGAIKISQVHLDLFGWLAKYYHYNLGQLLFESLPKLLKRPREMKFSWGKGEAFPFLLNTDQQKALDAIRENREEGFNKWLLHGVTGSGKTAVYLELVRDTIAEGKSVLFLLPEINLTPQFINKFERFVKAPIYSYNSSISASDKYGLWKLLREDDSPKIIIGVRSSIFLPIMKLGLVIVDEEHDSSFKQEDRCPYNARDIAIKRAHLEKCTIVLGSATPSVETFYNFKRDQRYLSMKKRVGEANLPKIELVDMTIGKQEGDLWPLSEKAINMTTAALEKGEQVVFFVNRLGYANYLQCRACGHQFHCPNCSVNLKYFKARNEISCNSCGYSQKAPQICPECQNMNLHLKGYGTEKLQDVLASRFEPRYRVERFDRDEILNFKKLSERLDEFHSGKIDILVGTQMLSKGHNFEKVNLVVIAGVDAQLNFPDFRANERVFQLLTQVAGRSGRFGAKANVLVHTLNTENQVFDYVTKHSFDQFYQDELEIRKICRCSPFAKLAMIYLTGKFQDLVIRESLAFAEQFRCLAQKHFSSVEVVGPRPSFVEKRVNKYTWSLLVRSEEINQLHNALNTVLNSSSFDRSISIKIDIDPSIIT